MSISSQTLVLIDNSLSVSEVNREITKETLKYFFSHQKEGRAFCFAPFSHDLEYAESYTEDYIGLEDMAERLEYENKEISLTDVVTKILNEWDEGDFACRDILIFTDGKEEKAVNYEREELFYVLEHSEYPVYIVCLDQENAVDGVKNLSAIARVSGGKLFHSDFEGSDAEVERLLSEQIEEAMEDYAAANWEIYDETKSDEDVKEESEDEDKSTEETETDDSITNVIKEEYSAPESFLDSNGYDDVIYETKTENAGMTPAHFGIMAGALFFAVCLLFICWCLYLRHKKKMQLEEDKYRDRILRRVSEVEEGSFDIRNYEGVKKENDMHIGGRPFNSSGCGYSDMGQTVSLMHRNPENSMSDGSTRMLYEGAANCDMTFEDLNDPSRYYRCQTHGKLVLGRSKDRCDLAFEHDDSVSARHCQIDYHDDNYYVHDLGSSNGTQINGEKVYTESILQDGDVLKLGSLSLMVRFS